MGGTGRVLIIARHLGSARRVGVSAAHRESLRRVLDADVFGRVVVKEVMS